MRLATWNIGGGFTSPKRDGNFNTQNLDYFASELATLNPDVVCLQDVHSSIKRDQTEELARVLNMKFWTTHLLCKSHLTEGELLSISIMSKYTLSNIGFNKLRNPKLELTEDGNTSYSQDKGFVEATLETYFPGRPVKILSGHAVPFKRFGRNFMDDEFEEIRRHIEDVISGQRIPILVGADMNFNDVEVLLPKLFDRGFKNVLGDVVTTPNGNKYDKILVSQDWMIKRRGVVNGCADHYLCYADININRR